jgi:radical SAM superfamily enzyme with C-terminal helix-hairpin-helix motif
MAGVTRSVTIYLDEVVCEVAECDGCAVILDLLAKGIRQASETPHGHAHAEIVPFNVTGADVLAERPEFIHLETLAFPVCHGAELVE